MAGVQKLLHPATADMPVDVDFLATRFLLIPILPQFSGHLITVTDFLGHAPCLVVSLTS